MRSSTRVRPLDLGIARAAAIGFDRCAHAAPVAKRVDDLRLLTADWTRFDPLTDGVIALPAAAGTDELREHRQVTA
jgi:hypothetical protein